MYAGSYRKILRGVDKTLAKEKMQLATVRQILE